MRSSGNANPLLRPRGASSDLIEEALFARRRDLFTALDLVFFGTTSLFFGDGGETLGQYGKSKVSIAAIANRWCWGW